MIIHILQRFHFYFLFLCSIVLFYQAMTCIRTGKYKNKRFISTLLVALLLVTEATREFLTFKGIISTPDWYILVMVVEYLPVFYVWSEFLSSGFSIIYRSIWQEQNQKHF